MSLAVGRVTVTLAGQSVLLPHPWPGHGQVSPAGFPEGLDGQERSRGEHRNGLSVISHCHPGEGSSPHSFDISCSSSHESDC